MKRVASLLSGIVLLILGVLLVQNPIVPDVPDGPQITISDHDFVPLVDETSIRTTAAVHNLTEPLYSSEAAPLYLAIDVNPTNPENPVDPGGNEGQLEKSLPLILPTSGAEKYKYI